MLTKEQFFLNIPAASREATRAYFEANPEMLNMVLAAANKGEAKISVYELMQKKEAVFNTELFATAIARDLKSRIRLKLPDSKNFSVSEKSINVSFSEDFKTVKVTWTGDTIKVEKKVKQVKQAPVIVYADQKKGEVNG